MSLSIVIVCFGGRLDELLDELAGQLRAGDEVVVVDNLAAAGGTDGVRGHARVDVVVEPDANLGFAAGVNRGAERASGETLVLLNPDVVPAPGCLDALRDPPAEWAAWMGVVTLLDPSVVNTAGGVSHFTGISWIGGYGAPVASLPEGPFATGFLSGACLAIRRNVWQRIGGFPDTFFLYLEDVDLSHRLRLAGLAHGVLPTARVAHDYVFDKGPLKWRCLERNRWKLVLRTYPAPVLAAALPVMLAAELPILAAALAGGWGRAKLGSWLDVLRWLPRARTERREVQALRVVSPAAFAAALTPDLDTPLLGAPGRSTVLRLLLRAYWRGARALIARAPR